MNATKTSTQRKVEVHLVQIDIELRKPGQHAVFLFLLNVKRKYCEVHARYRYQVWRKQQGQVCPVAVINQRPKTKLIRKQYPK